MGEYQHNHEIEQHLGRVAVDPLLAEVALLERARTPEGGYYDDALQDIFANLVSDSYESIAPNGRSVVEQTWQDGEFWWMGMGSVENSRNGHAYCQHDFAHRRVDVEEEEAQDALNNLKPGWAKITISPRAKGTIDASDQEAQDEQLHDRDLVRIQYLRTDENGQVTGKVIESIQAFDVPLQAWVDMLAAGALTSDSVTVDEPNSALAVLKTHTHLYVPLDELSNGAVSVLEIVKDFIDEPASKVSLARQLEQFAVDQAAMRQHIEEANEERLHFLCQLTDSLRSQQATPYVNQYIDAHRDQFKGQQRLLVEVRRRADGTYRMDTELAKICSGLNKIMTAVRAGVAINNQELINKINNDGLVNRIRTENALLGNMSWEQQLRYRQATNQAIAQSGIRPSGGCSGEVGNIFGIEDSTLGLEQDMNNVFGEEAESEEDYDFDKEMYCVVCQAPPKNDDEPKKMCGPCGICKTCDTKIRAKSAAA